jgi:hypothetical protein
MRGGLGAQRNGIVSARQSEAFAAIVVLRNRKVQRIWRRSTTFAVALPLHAGSSRSRGAYVYTDAPVSFSAPTAVRTQQASSLTCWREYVELDVKLLSRSVVRQQLLASLRDKLRLARKQRLHGSHCFRRRLYGDGGAWQPQPAWLLRRRSCSVAARRRRHDAGMHVRVPDRSAAGCTVLYLWQALRQHVRISAATMRKFSAQH